MKGEEKKKIDKGANAKELRNFGRTNCGLWKS